MNKLILTGVCAILLLTSCSEHNAEITATPAEIYAALSEAAELPEMVELPRELMPDYYGIEADRFESAVSYSCLNPLLPDEIVIVKAVSEDAADAIRKKLESRLAYKKKAAQDYLPESIPAINDAVIRQDGLIVSMLVSSDIETMIKVYKTIK